MDSFTLYVRPFLLETYYPVVFDLNRDATPSAWNMLSSIRCHSHWARVYYIGTEPPAANTEGVLLTGKAIAGDLRSLTKGASTAYVVMSFGPVPQAELRGELMLSLQPFKAVCVKPQTAGIWC